MCNLVQTQDMSLVTAITCREYAKPVVRAAVEAGAVGAVTLFARGTLVKDKWYQRFLPVMNPEQEVLETLVPAARVDAVMAAITVAGKLYRYGAGAVYSMHCITAVVPAGAEKAKKAGAEMQIDYKKDMAGIYCIAQKGKSEEIARAALESGAPGPTIVFGQGRGVRERLGLLRIAISPEKELIRVVVDSCDAEPVFAAMAHAGKLDMPGMGFIYLMPVQKGLINIRSVVGSALTSASLQQVIKAIDDLKGNTSWRAISQSEQDCLGKKKYLTGLVRLTFMVERGNADALAREAMAAGAPGASITYGREIGLETRAPSGITVNREEEIVEIIVPPARVHEIAAAIVDTAERENVEDLLMYTLPVPKALTYLE